MRSTALAAAALLAVTSLAPSDASAQAAKKQGKKTPNSAPAPAAPPPAPEPVKAAPTAPAPEAAVPAPAPTSPPAATPAVPNKPQLIRVGMMGIRAAGSDSPQDRALAAQLSEVALTEIGTANGITVIGQSDIAELVGIERERQLLGCSEDSTSCMTEVVGALDVQYMVVGTLVRIEQTTRIDFKTLSVADGKVLARAGEAVKGEQDEIIQVVIRMVRAVVTPIGAKHGFEIDFSRPYEVPLRRKVAYGTGAVGAGLLATGAVFGTLAFLSYNQGAQARTDNDPAAWDAANQDLKTRARTADILLGTGAVLAGVGAYLFFTSPAQVVVTPSVSAGSGAVTVSGRF